MNISQPQTILKGNTCSWVLLRVAKALRTRFMLWSMYLTQGVPVLVAN